MNEELSKLCDYFEPVLYNVLHCDGKKRKLNLPAISLKNEKKMLLKLKQIAEASL